MEKEELKRITKEALKEWLDEKFLNFGKWSFATIMAALLAALIYFILWTNGWSKNTSRVKTIHREALTDISK